jgi:hypothetical protein
MISLPHGSRIPFAVLGISAVAALYWLNSRHNRRNKRGPTSEIQGFLDWVEAESDIFCRPESQLNTTDTESLSDNVLHRALASLGLAATSPRQARTVRDPSVRISRVTEVHPATGNEEIADDVVRVVRVSEAEEEERYFSSFPYNQ